MTTGIDRVGSTFYGSVARFATLGEIAGAARTALPEDVFDYLESGAGEERTLHRNRAAFGRWGWLPHTMSGNCMPDLSTAFLGIPLSMPVLTAPFGADGLFHPDGHLAVGRANAAEGVASIVPEAGTHSIEDVAAAAPAAARVAQLHPMGSPDNFRAMLERIARAGYSAVCVTVDCPTVGWRERNMVNRFEPDNAVISGNYPPGGPVAPEDVFGQLFVRDEPVWSWDELGALMRDCPLPWMAKGILTGHDAEAAVAAGADAVLVSNHGGRQLDGAPATLDQLPEVVGAVGGRAAIAFDSGVRRGSDAAIALALGAEVVVLGRLAAYGLAADGERGVRRVHQLLRAELTTLLTLLGQSGVSDLGPHLLCRVDGHRDEPDHQLDG